MDRKTVGDNTMNRAILVVGGESTGTRLMTRILIGMGYYGDGDHVQRLDKEIPKYPAIVWRRSVPHAHEYPPLRNMVEQLRGLDYSVSALVMFRDWGCTAKSQVAAPHAESEEQAICNLQKAYVHIFEQLKDVSFKMVSYEALTQRPELTVWRLLDLPVIRDENEKWYQ